jgi:hypothetical protein
MPNLLSLIKQAAVEAVAEGAPCAVLFGKVASPSPPRVSVEDRFVLESGQLVRTEAARELRQGDTVLLLRTQGGGKYIILGRIL